MAKTCITKKVKAELKFLIDTKGYWSKEVREYIEQFHYYKTMELHDMAHAYINHNEGELTKINYKITV